MYGDGSQFGIPGWGNNELQTYRKENAVVSGGVLRITAREEPAGDTSYSSARIRSIGKRDFTYGYYEARIKLPEGKGLWPAFWMLPTENVYGGWPQSGELDIMEWVGRNPNEILGTIHFGKPNGGNRNQGPRILAADGSFANEERTFGVEWRADTIRWFLDGYFYGMQTRDDLAPERWPFDQEFHFLLNMAVGGNLGGPVESGIFPATMEVDYVRVYDGVRPYLTGVRALRTGDPAALYRVNAADGMEIAWTVPAGATIVSGQGTNAATVDWGSSTGGSLTAEVVTPCGPEVLTVEVTVGAELTQSSVLEDFDEVSALELEFNSGAFTEVPNPAPDDNTGLSTVGQYVRDAGSVFDVIVYKTAAITEADNFSEGRSEFRLDVWTEAPVGTQILLQIESEVAAGEQFPNGRHSRYEAFTTTTGNWETLSFKLLNLPDPSVPSDRISRFVVLLAQNTNTDDTYYLDNFEVFSEEGVVPTLDVPLDKSFGLTVPAGGSVRDALTIDYRLDAVDPASYQVVNVAGQILRRGVLAAGTAGVSQKSIDVSSLPAGAYAVRIIQGGQAEAARFSKF